jgi:hypothetical protein
MCVYFSEAYVTKIFFMQQQKFGLSCSFEDGLEVENGSPIEKRSG